MPKATIDGSGLPVIHPNAELGVPVRCDGVPQKLGTRFFELSFGDIAFGLHDGLVVGRPIPRLEVVGRGSSPLRVKRRSRVSPRNEKNLCSSASISRGTPGTA